MRFILPRKILSHRNDNRAIRHSNARSRSRVRHVVSFAVVLPWFTYSVRVIGGASGRRLGRSPRTRGRERAAAAAIVESSSWHASRAQPVREPTDRIHLSMKSIERSSLSLSFPFHPPVRSSVRVLSTTERTARCNRVEQITCYVVTVSSPGPVYNPRLVSGALVRFSPSIFYRSLSQRARERGVRRTTTCRQAEAQLDTRDFNSHTLRCIRSRIHIQLRFRARRE